MTEIREQILAVQRMQDYIETHLCEEIVPADLAGAALFSPWYAWRLFKQYTGLTPAGYLRRLRLSRSTVLLREGRSITEVAFALGFGSVDGYQRAFLREFGCNPGRYAASPQPLPLFVPYGVKYRIPRKESETMKKITTVYIQRVHKPARRVIIKRGRAAADYWSYCQEVGCEVWGILTSMESLCGEPVCLWLPEACRTPGTSEYVQGVEVAPDFAGPVPEGFDSITLPAAEYLMFQGEPFEEEDYEIAIAQLERAVKNYHPEVLGLAWDPANPRIQLEPIGTRGYIELWPVTGRKA